MSLSFAQIQHAYDVQDPLLVDKLCQLALQPDPTPTRPIADNELTFDRFLQKISTPSFRAQDEEVQFAERVAMIAKLEADEGAYPLPPRFRIYVVLLALWEDGSSYAREVLKQAITKLPLSYGVWKGLKRIYKSAEYQQDFEIFALITAKIDLYRFDKSAKDHVSVPTKTYMSLRAWRYLRQLGEQMPTAYLEAVVPVLASYEATMSVTDPSRMSSWVLNHICFHNSVSYGVNSFQHRNKRKLFDAKGRAFSEVWRRDYQPLITLLTTAKNEDIRQFATDSLKHDFKTALRDVSVGTLQYLSAGNVRSMARDEAIVWLLDLSPNFEKSRLSELGLHEVVLRLLYSEYSEAYEYAISYAKSYATDISVSELMFLANSTHEPVRKFAIAQILSRHPIKDIGLTGWGQLLDSDYHHKVASLQLAKHFSKKELTDEWFFERLTRGNVYSVDFAMTQLPKLYGAKQLGLAYFVNIAYQLDVCDPNSNTTVYGRYQNINQNIMDFVLEQLMRLDLTGVDAMTWQYLLLHPLSQPTLIEWFGDDVIEASKLPMSYWHALAYEPDWHKSDYISTLKNTNIKAKNQSDTLSLDDKSASDGGLREQHKWQQQLSFDEELAGYVRVWLSDVRRFAPTELGFDWLMTLAQSEQAVYRDFAINRINRGFLPADFAEFTKKSHKSASSTADTIANKTTDTTDKTSHASKHIDLQQKRFLFTGKMQGMTRGEAEKLVKEANGLISSAVNGKLDYLVIGDEGSPLYGNGRKGSKQVKAEALIQKGASLQIISETAFLQILTGTVRKVSDDATQAGSEALWQMATANPDAPISELALSYLTHHHDKICLALTDRPVDPDAVIDNSFFNAERIVPLLSGKLSKYTRLRNFGLLVAEYELANWQPTAKLWTQLFESPYSEVTDLLQRAFLDAPSSANLQYHIKPEQYDGEMIYALIGSQKRLTRHIGITLLQRNPHLQNATTLYQLTQSTQRDVRYAGVQLLWQHYKARHYATSWHTDKNPSKNVSSPRHAVHPPQQLLTDLPADFDDLLQLLRQGLFEVPPARLGGSKDSNAPATAKTATSDSNKNHVDKKDNSANANPANTNQGSSLRSISSSRAKLALIATFRDVALQDDSFAQVIMPVLYAFTHSAGKMERNACLVAVTRLLQRYPHLAQYLTHTA